MCGGNLPHLLCSGFSEILGYHQYKGGEGREEVLNPARGLDGISSSEFVDVDLIH